MRIRVVTALSAVVMLCGCASNGGLGSAPAATGSVRGNYQVLAACVAQKLDEPGLAKIDLPSENTSKVSLSSGGVRYWEVVLTGEGHERTTWSISVVNTMWGPFPRVGEKTERAIRECEAETPPVAAATVAAPVRAAPRVLPTVAPARVYHVRRGGCGSRGGAGYRLPNGKCASRRR